MFAAAQTIVDQNLYASHTKVLGTTTLNEARFSWINRDLQFPENDPDSPTAGIGGLTNFTIGGLANFPQGRVQDSYQFMDVLTFQKGRHSFKAGADIRYIDLDNVAAFDSKGTFTFDSLQDYMNNNARIFQQALQTASFTATQWSQFYFLQDDWRPTPTLTLNLGLRYENSTVPLGLFGATDPQSLGCTRPGSGQARQRQLRAARRVRMEPCARQAGSLKWLFGETTSSIPRRVREELRRALLQHPHRQRQQLSARGGRPRRQRARTLPEPRAGDRRRRCSTRSATFVNSPEDTREPGNTQSGACRGSASCARTYVFEFGYTGSARPQWRLSGPGQLCASCPQPRSRRSRPR